MVTREMLKILTAFHYRAAQQITAMTEKLGAEGEWKYPAVDEAIDSMGIHPIGVYIKRQKTNIAERVACWYGYALFTEAERIPGTIHMVRWWDQDLVNDTEE